MSEKKRIKRENKPAANKPPALTPEKLKLLVLIVNKQKTEFYTDFLVGQKVNLQLAVSAQGTASAEKLSLLGLVDEEKEVILATVKESAAPRVLEKLEQRFKTIKNGKGIAFTMPYSGVIGLGVYRFLSDDRTNFTGGKK